MSIASPWLHLALQMIALKSLIINHAPSVDSPNFLVSSPKCSQLTPFGFLYELPRILIAWRHLHIQQKWKSIKNSQNKLRGSPQNPDSLAKTLCFLLKKFVKTQIMTYPICTPSTNFRFCQGKNFNP